MNRSLSPVHYRFRENNTKMKLKEFFLKFAAGLLCVVMAAALLALFFMNHQRNAARTENLKKQAQELKQQAVDYLNEVHKPTGEKQTLE